jgi:ABC-type nickel/cobalt efflux system permease component RcnA
MGIGAIPCPGILAFLFYAMSNRMLWTGICAVMSVAIGMAAALCAVGMASIFANRKIGRDGPQGAKHSKAAAALRLASSLAIMVFGLVLLADSI